MGSGGSSGCSGGQKFYFASVPCRFAAVKISFASHGLAGSLAIQPVLRMVLVVQVAVLVALAVVLVILGAVLVAVVVVLAERNFILHTFRADSQLLKFLSPAAA